MDVIASAAESKNSKRPIAIRRIVAVAAVVGVVGLLALLYLFPPETQAVYPKCLFHWVTGLHCPGCGTARGMHSLLHGEVQQAAAYNVFLLIALPFLVYVGLRKIHSMIRNEHIGHSRLPGWSIRLLLIAIVLFWILRNVNVSPFQILAPHRLS